MPRVIGIQHRMKATTKGEERPTRVAILENDAFSMLELKSDTDELDFLLGRFPTGWRNAEPDEDLKTFREHHVRETKRKEVTTVKVPTGYEGFVAGDTVAMLLGGSGDRFAYALARRASQIGGKVLRMAPFKFMGFRNGASKDLDHRCLAELGATSPAEFYEVGPRELDQIRLQEAVRMRRFVQQDRIRCEQRLHQIVSGQVFLNDDGLYPEGKVEDEYDRELANDAVMQALFKRESACDDTVRSAVQALPVWREVLSGIEGMGEVIAGPILAAAGDIRRFANKAKFKAYCGVHLLKDGTFPRRRAGVIANWAGTARQAFYQLGKQFNYRADSVWGIKLREYKVKFRVTHPEPVIIDGKKKYTDGHIHNMGVWRAQTRFAEWMFKEWRYLDEHGVRRPALEEKKN